jgi:arylformamidase
MGIDAHRVVVAGNSAGGHLVAELMDTHWMAAMGLPDTCLRGGVAISGLYDLVPVALSFQNESLQLTNEETSLYSPLIRPVYIRAPLVVAVGGDETSEFLRQSAAFAAHCQGRQCPESGNACPAVMRLTGQ